MKRIYIECLIAVLILFWCISNMFITTNLFVVWLPAIVSFVIQFMGTIIMAACECEEDQ